MQTSGIKAGGIKVVDGTSVEENGGLSCAGGKGRERLKHTGRVQLR